MEQGGNGNTEPSTVHAPLPLRLLGHAADWIVILGGGLITALIFANVVANQFGYDLTWLDQFGELVMVWITFVGGMSACQRGYHMRIMEFVNMVGLKYRRWADLFGELVSFVIIAYVALFGWNLVQTNWDDRFQILGWPRSYEYLGMALGCSGMALFIAYDMLLTIRNEPRERRYKPLKD